MQEFLVYTVKMTNYIFLSDAELVKLLKSGDVPAFTQIYDRYWPPLVLHVHRMVRDENLAEDIVQELFTSIFQRAEDLEITASLSSYLYSAVRYRVFDVIKHERIKANYLEDISAFIEDAVYQTDERLRVKELAAVIEAEIQKMPPKMREIFDLSRKHHLTHKEIGQLLNISEHTVRTQIQRALKTLRNNKDIRTSIMILMIHLLQ